MSLTLQGDLLRDQALERLEDAHALWLETAVLVIARVAYTHPTFTSDDVWHALPTTLQTPPEPRALGAAMRMAKRDGTIVPTEAWTFSTRAVCHRRPLRVWASRVHR